MKASHGQLCGLLHGSTRQDAKHLPVLTMKQ